ncbi:hypothetical protein AOQ84DRAFT_140425 [Glonium stellatum]|uniref:DUF7137 domain-containing protein n=1 Tax=Glonium stellatum TaxID=574774 RepID=A0A8E2JX16_9PEZI|nr:hypothetical protein AOQ84DRAFT_140425 [Glonium stellatum]
MKPSQLLATALTFSSLSSAWPWPEAFGDIKAIGDVGGILYGRAGQNTAQATATSATDSPQSTDDSKQTKSDSAATTGGSAVATTDSVSATGKSSSKSTNSHKTTKATAEPTNTGNSSATTVFDPRLPAGGVQMVTPAAISGQQYYKIGEWLTFAWNYTSLSVTPTAIDVLATCTANQGTYTLALNQSTKETGKVLWDTGAYQSTATLPLLTETYTLLIFDADSSVSATAKAGYLAVYNQYTFGMYTPQPYTPWSDFHCPTCSAALSSTERQTLGFLFAMCTITVLSFTWFAGGFGVF